MRLKILQTWFAIRIAGYDSGLESFVGGIVVPSRPLDENGTERQYEPCPVILDYYCAPWYIGKV
jgi:hypothetical protein